MGRGQTKGSDNDTFDSGSFQFNKIRIGIITPKLLRRNNRCAYHATMSDHALQALPPDWRPRPIWHEGADPMALSNSLADWVAGHLRAGLVERGQASLAVSGGGTPVPFFQALGRHDLDWSRVHVTLVDERAVPAQHPDRNEGLVRTHLLQGPAAVARWLPCFVDADQAALTGDGLDGDLAALHRARDALEARLATWLWPVDVVVLGMGSDGHTASLFPGAAHAQVWGEGASGPGVAPRCLAVDVPPSPNVPVRRLSWSPRALLDTRHLAVHTTGRAKRELLQRACAASDLQELPIRLALWQDRVTCHLFHAD